MNMTNILIVIRILLYLNILFLETNSQSYDYQEPINDESYNNKVASLDSLKFVAIVARHGNRSPLYTYPTDPYPYNNQLFWPQGKGALTNSGKKQLYELGNILRKRYNGFLPLKYNPNDTLATYNPVDRDFESVACLLAALYPPVGDEVWNPNLLWQPVPAKPYDFDVCALLKNGKCPEFTEEAYKSAALYGLKVAVNTTCLLKYVSKHTGQHLFTALQLLKIFDILEAQKENGFKLPEWANEVYPTEIREIAVHTLNALYAGSDKILSLTAGPELQHISSLFARKMNGSLAENTKLYVEAVHDCTLYPLLKAMGSPLAEEMVLTSAYITFELHQLDPSYIVQVRYYRQYSDENPTDINIKDCPSPCSLEKFYKFTQNIAGTVSWDKACQKIDIF